MASVGSQTANVSPINMMIMRQPASHSYCKDPKCISINLNKFSEIISISVCGMCVRFKRQAKPRKNYVFDVIML